MVSWRLFIVSSFWAKLRMCIWRYLFRELQELGSGCMCWPNLSNLKFHAGCSWSEFWLQTYHEWLARFWNRYACLSPTFQHPDILLNRWFPHEYSYVMFFLVSGHLKIGTWHTHCCELLLQWNLRITDKFVPEVLSIIRRCPFYWEALPYYKVTLLQMC